jgi:capsular polysaccharide biosynthesis protein
MYRIRFILATFSEETNMEEQRNIIDLREVFKKLWSKKKTFLVVWVITFILSCIWIFPQPRYYQAKVSLAPEITGEDIGGLAGIASSFGVNLGSNGTDALYPTLYPDLMKSNNFIVGLMPIQITTTAKDNEPSIHTDYYTYQKKHQKKNPLTSPLYKVLQSLEDLFSKEGKGTPITAKELNPFILSKKDADLFEKVITDISCDIDKRTNVISISVKDQDPLVCATMADSVRQHLQDFIILYRTKKARIDVDHYQHLADSAKLEYESAVNKYSIFCDANQDVVLQRVNSKRDALEQDMQFKYNTYNALATQLEAMKAKVQEHTPAFTTLKNASVPIKPAGPKRLIFIAAMMFLASICTVCYIFKREIIDNL